MILMDKHQKEAFARSIATYHVPGDVFICSSKGTTSGTATGVRVTTLTEFSIVNVILHDPFVFCTDQIGELKGNRVRTTTPASFMSLMVVLTSWNVILFSVY